MLILEEMLQPSDCNHPCSIPPCLPGTTGSICCFWYHRPHHLTTQAENTVHHHWYSTGIDQIRPHQQEPTCHHQWPWRSSKGHILASDPDLLNIQGSVLGSILYTLYTTPLEDICRKHQVEAQFYADDQQIYLSFRPTRNNNKQQETCIKRLEQCIEDARAWMAFNLLKLNDDKTEFIIFGKLQQFSKINEISITVGLVSIQPVKFV